MQSTSSSSDPPSNLEWLGPAYRAAPAEALDRIRQICAMHTELFGAVFVVLATHHGLPLEILAVAVKQYRADTEALTRDDVVSLMVATRNGGRQGFDAVLRTRRGVPRGAGAMSWVKD
jgi:hypothetical protein